MSRILVIGGAGYVGSALVPLLQEGGHQVEVVDLLWFGNHLPETVPVVRKDAFSLQEPDLERFEQVVFMAGLSNDPMAEYSPSKNFVFNAALPGYLAYIAKRAGVRRFIYGGTCSVYGFTQNDANFDEEAPASCAYPYGISKLQGELAALYLADPEFSVVALRKGTVCGYSPRMRLDLVVNTMFKTSLQSGEIKINNPDIWRPIVGIRDAAGAYLRSIEADWSVSGVFNILSCNYTVGDIGAAVAGEVERLLGCKIEVSIKHLQEFRSYKVSGDKAARVLGFQPCATVESIVADLAAHRAEFADMDNPKYYNIEIFRKLDVGMPATAQILVHK